jgi:hypothetical protein
MAQPSGVGYALRWPDGHEIRAAVFSRDEAEQPGTTLLSLEDGRIRALTTQMPVFAPGQPIATLLIPGVSDKVAGFWSLWRISLQSDAERQRRAVAVFVSDDGRVLAPTARAVWDRLIGLGDDVGLHPGVIANEAATAAYDASRRAAETLGAPVFDELAGTHRESVRRERAKGRQGFAARRRAIERSGLLQVRARRLTQLASEEALWEIEMGTREHALPELVALTIIRVDWNEA